MKTPTLTEYGTYEYREEGDETNSSQAAPIPHIPKDEDSLPKEVNPNNPFAAGKMLYDDKSLADELDIPKHGLAQASEAPKRLKASRFDNLDEVWSQNQPKDILTLPKVNQLFREAQAKHWDTTGDGKNQPPIESLLMATQAILSSHRDNFVFADINNLITNPDTDRLALKKLFDEWCEFLIERKKLQRINGCYGSNDPVYRFI